MLEKNSYQSTGGCEDLRIYSNIYLKHKHIHILNIKISTTEIDFYVFFSHFFFLCFGFVKDKKCDHDTRIFFLFKPNSSQLKKCHPM